MAESRTVESADHNWRPPHRSGPEADSRGIVNFEKAGLVLTNLRTDLEQAVSISDLRTLERKAEAFRKLLRMSKFHCEWEREFFKLRVRTMVEMGKLLSAMEKHRGGRPSGNPSSETTGSPPTLEELGISRDFSSDCQYLASYEKHIAGYYEKAEREGWEVFAIKGDKGVLHHIGWEATREANARDREKRTAETIKEAEAAVAGADPQITVQPDTDGRSDGSRIEIDPELFDRPEPPLELERPKRKADTIIKVLKKAVDVAEDHPEEALVALRTLRNSGDARLETLSERDDQHWQTIQLFKDFDKRRHNQIEALQAKLREFSDAEEKIKKLEARDRERLRVIRELRADNERLKSELARNGGNLDPSTELCRTLDVQIPAEGNNDASESNQRCMTAASLTADEITASASSGPLQVEALNQLLDTAFHNDTPDAERLNCIRKWQQHAPGMLPSKLVALMSRRHEAMTQAKKPPRKSA